VNKIDFESIEEKIRVSGVAKIISELEAGDSFVVSEVPEKYQADFLSYGFCEYAHFKDYWIDPLSVSDKLFNNYDFLLLSECIPASEITTACRGQSRGFEGENPEWFKQWLNGKEEGQMTAGCQNSSILTYREKNKIIGISCTATYAHNSEKGKVVWVRMLSVHPDYQGQGIGTKLLLQTLRYGVEHGAKRAFLHADTQNTAAIRIYSKVGFLSQEGIGQVDMIWR